MTRPEIKLLDKLFSKTVRQRGKCQRCQKAGITHAHHIISRTHRNTRWNLSNGLELCYRCHIHFAHADPILFTEWVTGLLGKKHINTLKKLSRKSPKGQDFEMIKKILEDYEWNNSEIPL